MIGQKTLTFQKILKSGKNIGRKQELKNSFIVFIYKTSYVYNKQTTPIHRRKMKNETITQEYAEKMRPLVPLAQKAFGAKNQNTPAHLASKEYTRLLVEFVSNHGNLMSLSKELDVSYSGLRRRVFTSAIPPISSKNTRKKLNESEIEEAIDRVRHARAGSKEEYHAQLATEFYDNGVPLAVIAKGLGISNAGPLYYGIQRHTRRMTDAI
jgi:hypothetical protein